MRNYRNYTVWSDGMRLYASVFEVTRNFPKTEQFGLTSQIRRAAISVPSNIAEGCSRTSELEFKRFIEISLGSLFELETQLIGAHMVKYLSKESLESLESRIAPLRYQLLSLRGKLGK